MTLIHKALVFIKVPISYPDGFGSKAFPKCVEFSIIFFLQSLSGETEIKAANGKSMKAIDVFSYSLRFFKEHVVEELSDQMSTKLVDNDICWVITVPAIWKAGAKQFMRKAAYDVSLKVYMSNNVN